MKNYPAIDQWIRDDAGRSLKLTGALRFKNGILQQKFIVVTKDDIASITTIEEWLDVPSVEE